MADRKKLCVSQTSKMAQITVRPGSFSADTLPESIGYSGGVQLEKPPSKSKRMLALDLLRGLAVFLMLLVNNVALDDATPKQLLHAPWNLGIRLADLVFPWFLFCVGVSIPYSRAGFSRFKRPALAFLGRVSIRAVALVGIGILLDSAIDHRLGFGLGVLQLIGLAYFVASVSYEASPWIRVLFGSALLFAYGLALRRLDFAGGSPGLFEESNNWARHFNDMFLTRHGLRGLLSTVPTAALVLYGTLIGDILRDKTAKIGQKLAGMVISGAALVALGDVWSTFLPYNKPFWTPPYILVAGGLGALILAAAYVIVDVGHQGWIAYPFTILGSNAILAYVAPILVKVLILQVIFIQTTSGAQNLQKAILELLKGNYGNVPGGWAYTGGYIFFWWLVLWLLYQRKVFLRV